MKLMNALKMAALWTATSLSLLGAAQVSAQGAKPPPKFTLTIAVPGDTLIFLPIYVARSGGFFEEEGIKVDWVNVGPSSRQAPAVMGGSADVTPLSLFHMVHAQKRGLKLVTLSAIMDATAIQLTLTNDAVKKSGIVASMPMAEKLKRLKGMTIGTSAPGSGTETIFRKMLQYRGMDPDRWLTLKPVGGAAPSLAAFENGLVDGVVYPAPVPEIIEAKGTGKTVIDGFKEDIAEVTDVPFLVLATSQETLTKKPELMAATARAMAKAMNFAQKNPEKVATLLRQYFKDSDEAIYLKMVESYRKATAKTPLITAAQVAKTAKWVSIGEPTPFVVKYEDIVAVEPARSAAAAFIGR
ncbi:MAG: ABC transporter substrate-binding protein [Burkholderiaceae bacterium]|nr:ABC transporter substrate-binding protein [Burkholderiaceae bacterium]